MYNVRGIGQLRLMHIHIQVAKPQIRGRMNACRRVFHFCLSLSLCSTIELLSLASAEYSARHSQHFLERHLTFYPITHFSVLPVCSQEGPFSSHDVRTIILQRHLPSGIRFYDCNLTPFLCPISDRAVTHFKGRRHQITVRP